MKPDDKTKCWQCDRVVSGKQIEDCQKCKRETT
jgi:hypothetical protein